MECRKDGQQRHDGGLCVVCSEGLDQLQVVLSKTTTWPDPHLLMCVCAHTQRKEMGRRWAGDVHTHAERQDMQGQLRVCAALPRHRRRTRRQYH